MRALTPLAGHSFSVLVSPGAEERGTAQAARMSKALAWLERTAGASRAPTLYVLDEAHWGQGADIPVYGMPQAVPGKVVAPVSAAAWLDDCVAAVGEAVGPARRQELDRTWSTTALATAQVDLVVVHEVTHLIEDSDPVTWTSPFPTLWLSELFANVGMYGYLSEVEPDLLPAFLVLGEAAREAGPLWPVEALADMGESFQYGPGPYVWFQMLLTLVAGQVWADAGTESLRALLNELGDASLSPREVVERLRGISATAAASVEQWPRF